MHLVIFKYRIVQDFERFYRNSKIYWEISCWYIHTMLWLLELCVYSWHELRAWVHECTSVWCLVLLTLVYSVKLLAPSFLVELCRKDYTLIHDLAAWLPICYSKITHSRHIGRFNNLHLNTKLCNKFQAKASNYLLLKIR